MLDGAKTNLASPQLKKSIGLVQATIYGVGIILGAGIYALIGEAVAIAGNSVWIAFVVSALIAACSALSYAELSASFPKSAAEFVYVKHGSGSNLLAFIIGYTTVVTGVISVSAVALGFSTYFKLYLDVNPVLIANVVIVLAALLNFKGIEESARVNTVFTLVETFGLLFVIAIGLPFIGEVDIWTNLHGDVPTGSDFWHPIFAASALIFFAYLGFEDVANIAEETKDATRTVPLALLLSLLITTVIYVLIAIVAVSVVSAEQLAASAHLGNPGEGPLALVVSTALDNPIGGLLFTVVALFATANTVLVLMIVSSRMLFGMAREKTLPAALAKIHPRNQTPQYAILTVALLSVFFTSLGSLGDVANLTNVGIFLVFFAVNMSLILLRFKQRHVIRPARSWASKLALNIGWFPVLPTLGALFCLGMLLTQFNMPIRWLGLEWSMLVLALALFLTSVPIYFLYKNHAHFERL
ncbi:MAG: amino acid permease [Gammaproteobacteria bacterium]|nr:amino acid permease [Gammaproteobacteria bacterium]